MPIIGSRGAASGFGFGQRQGGKTFDLHYMIVAGGDPAEKIWPAVEEAEASVYLLVQHLYLLKVKLQ